MANTAEQQVAKQEVFIPLSVVISQLLEVSFTVLYRLLTSAQRQTEAAFWCVLRAKKAREGVQGATAAGDPRGTVFLRSTVRYPNVRIYVRQETSSKTCGHRRKSGICLLV